MLFHKVNRKGIYAGYIAGSFPTLFAMIGILYPQYKRPRKYYNFTYRNNTLCQEDLLNVTALSLHAPHTTPATPMHATTNYSNIEDRVTNIEYQLLNIENGEQWWHHLFWVSPHFQGYFIIHPTVLREEVIFL